ncbi:RSP_7527 family protein [Oceaniglobus roseus]|uniref:RSP_7527 family protein n=1 Tax=Oceaniglobus roseus TaxID=1737570 RepID=UPI001300144F|nr:hypothetical protein [Kandeliimicrobium roseum]
MIPKKTNPNDAIDLFEIERQARALRAATLRDFGATVRAWFASRPTKAPARGLQPLKG